ncbi:XRE family transcriptional regulator [Brevibacillus panacihumi W25]|uniref:XRE family transcriptional regulator n=1 Tax=Brevibacillus panacihumi W25 TaxID=1408254 RepID=V6MBV6_9BACL|nr:MULTISPECIES: helix-turn-helix transcriptional regulator [Brevibacillus]EST55370.1 XRE family transcriptional regulator [Brevibacillus panacihumi W25]MCM3077477.1 helix-turn-helix domain-containing protein [Brevibacillus invocatus]MCM3429686.1 helix-turn-helix domain-containing protein [Brevibacillus invocatus]
MEESTKQLAKMLGERIRSLRLEQGLSQEQLGERSGLHTNYIGQIERGEKNLTLETLLKIARSLGTSLEQLLHSVDPLDVQTPLGQIVVMLSERPVADQALVLALMKTVFSWEEEKRK